MNIKEYELKQKELINKAYQYLNDLTFLTQQFSEEQAQGYR